VSVSFLFFFFFFFAIDRRSSTISTGARNPESSTSSCFRYDLARSLRHGIHDPRPRRSAGTSFRVRDAQIIRERVVVTLVACSQTDRRNKLLPIARQAPGDYSPASTTTRLRNHELVLLMTMNLVRSWTTGCTEKSGRQRDSGCGGEIS